MIIYDEKIASEPVPVSVTSMSWLCGYMAVYPDVHQLTSGSISESTSSSSLAYSAAVKKRRLEDIFKCPKTKTIAVQFSKTR